MATKFSVTRLCTLTTDNTIDLQPPLHPTTFKSPFLQPNAFLQTVVPALFRKTETPPLEQEYFSPEEGVNLDLYWAKANKPASSDGRPKEGKKLVVLQHGLEGNATRFYMMGMLNHLLADGWDGLLWSYRGCGNSTNTTQLSYHAGFTKDLEAVVDYTAAKNYYSKIALVGFSMGGNISLNYLANPNKPATVVGGMAISVPCDLHSSAKSIGAPKNRIFQRRFLKSLKTKVREKVLECPDMVDLRQLDQINDIIAFDDFFTAPVNGFDNAMDYYTRSSSLSFMDQIDRPFLVLNAENDPYLGASCYPRKLAKTLQHFELMTTATGGHCGFATREGAYFHEMLAVDFLNRL